MAADPRPPDDRNPWEPYVCTGRKPGCNPTYHRWVPASARWESLTCVAGGTVNGVVKSGKHAGANISLPSALGQLSGLTRLSLRDHNHTLTGEIPSEIGQLSRLAVLELDDSSLRGDLPMQLASLTSLRILNLARTDVAGTLPTQLAQLTRLTRLHLSETRVSGFLPSQLGSLSMLTHIELGAQHSTPDTRAASRDHAAAHLSRLQPHTSRLQPHVHVSRREPPVGCAAHRAHKHAHKAARLMRHGPAPLRDRQHFRQSQAGGGVISGQ